MSDINNSPIKKQKSETLLNQDFDFQAPAGHSSLSQFSTSTPPATPLRNNGSSTTLPKSAASEDIFSPSLFGITMTPTTYNFSQLHGMTSSGTYLDSEGNVIYENMPPVPTSRDWTPSMKNLLPTESADFSCFNDAHMMSPPISKRAASMPSSSSTGFQPSEGIHNFIPSSDDSLDNIRFAKSNPVDDAPHGSRIGQISKSHLMSNKKALADRLKHRRPQQVPDPSSYQRVTRLTSKQQQSHSSSSSAYSSYADAEDEPRSPFRRRTQSGIAMQSSSDYNGNAASTPIATTKSGNVDSPDLIGDTSNLSGFAAITAAAESVEDGGSNGYFKFAESNSSKVTISTSYLPSSSSSIGNRAGSFSPMHSHRSPTHSPTRSPMYTIINSPLDLLGSVAAHHENFPTEDFPFSQISGDAAHSLLIYDHQLSNDSNSRLAYRTYSMDNNSSDNLLNFGVTKKSKEELDYALSKLPSAVPVDTAKRDDSVASVKNESLSSASSIQSTSKGIPLVVAPTPSASASDPAHAMKTSSLKKSSSEAMNKARSDQNLLYLSPEVVVNLDKIGTLDKQSNPELVSCKCKKSRCLKMYCDCFRLQQYCRQCTCSDCANVVGQEVLRAASIASIVERNPEAFKPRVAEDNSSKAKNHLTGCRCRRSNCLKKYCECFTGNVICYDRCRCFECKNTNSEIFEIGLRLKTGSSTSNLNRNRIPVTTAYSANARSPDDDSLIGYRLEDIKAAADVIDTFKSSTRNETLPIVSKTEARTMGEENSSSTTADRGRKLSFHIASTPAAQSSIPRTRRQVPSQQEVTPMEKKFAPEGSMYRDIPTPASSATSGGSNTRRATPINLDQNMLQNTNHETESKIVHNGGGDQMSSKAEEHSDDFSLSVSLKECVEDEDKSSAFVKSIKL